MNVTDDQKLLETLNPGGSEDEKEKPPKEKKKNKKKEEPRMVEAEIKVPEKVESSGELDPMTEFVKLLTGVGIKKEKAEIVAAVFYKGSIDDPEWLDKALILGDLGIKHRELVITSYYGATPQELGIELLPQSKMKQNAQMKTSQEVVSDSGDVDLQKLNASLLRDKFKALQNRQLLQQLEDMENKDRENRDKSKAPAVPKKIIQRPMINKEGQIVKMEDGTPIMERVVVEGGDGIVGGMSGMDSLVPILLAKVLDDKKPAVPVTDPNSKPVWALDLEKKLELQKADEDKRRLEDELKREKEKRENLEKEYQKQLSEVEKRHQKDIDMAREDTKVQIKHMEDRFTDDKRHREEVDNLQSAYGQKLEEIKKELDTTRKDIKSVVAQEGVKTASSVIKSVTQTGEEIVKPVAETITEGFKLQLDTMRKNAGLTKEVPGTTEEELKSLV